MTVYRIRLVKKNPDKRHRISFYILSDRGIMVEGNVGLVGPMGLAGPMTSMEAEATFREWLVHYGHGGRR